MDAENEEKPRRKLLSVKNIELTPETDFKLFFLMIVVLIAPAALTLLSVEEAITFKPSTTNPTPLGYTWSLLLWIVPIIAIFIWIHTRNDEKFLKKSFWYAIIILIPLAFILDILFGLSFFTFGNPNATIQINLYGLTFSPFGFEKKLPIEEFVFYITGVIAVLLIYIWCDEYWLEAYNIDYKTEAQEMDRIVVFHPKSLLLGAILIILAIIYKYLFTHPYNKGFPGYFVFLVLANIIPSAAFFRTTLKFINWRAFAATFFFVLLVSLIWEATLAAPYQWWNYNNKQMLGIMVGAWHKLPIEAVIVWLMVTFTTVIIYEVLKIWLNSKKKAKHAFFGKVEKDGEYEEEQRKLELCTFDDDLPHLTEAEIQDKQDSHEWYYFDVQTKDKEELVVRYIIKDSTVHDTNPAISLEFTTKTKTKEIERIKDYSRDDYKIEKMDNEKGVTIKIDTNLIKIYRDHENNIKKYILILKFDEFEMNLECTPMHQGFKLSKNRSYIRKKADNDIYLCAVFPAPRMKVKGELIIAQKRLELEGEGYHDHTWGTTSFIYSHKEWHWGRVYTDEFTVLFTKVIPSNGYYGKLNVLYFAKTDTAKPKLENDLEITPENWKTKFTSEFPFMFKFPHELSIKSLKENLSIKTKFKEILILIKIYIRIKADVNIIENTNNLSGAGWVEYLKIPSLHIIQKLLIFFTKREYNSDKWRKK